MKCFSYHPGNDPARLDFRENSECCGAMSFFTPPVLQVRIDADASAALERRHIVNEFVGNVERHRRELLLHCWLLARHRGRGCRKLYFAFGAIATA